MPLNWANVDFLNAISDALWYREHCTETTTPTVPTMAAMRTSVGAGAGNYLKSLGDRMFSMVGDRASSFGPGWYNPAVSGQNLTTLVPAYTTAEWASIVGNGSGAGWTHKFFKEITSTAVTSATWADGSTLANGDVVRSRADGRNYLRSGGAWVASSNAMPDIVTSYSWATYLNGEMIGQWIFDEWRNALGAMTRRVITDQAGDAFWDAGNWFAKGGTGSGSDPSLAAAQAAAVAQANTNFAANTGHITSGRVYAATLSSVSGSFNAAISVYDAASDTLSTAKGAWLTRTATFLAKTGLYGTFGTRTYDAQGVPAISPGVYRIWDTQTGSGTLTSVRLGLTGPPPDLSWTSNEFLGFQVDGAEVTLDFPFPALGF